MAKQITDPKEPVEVYTDFAKLDLSNIIQGPLVAAVSAQKAAALATREYILSMIGAQNVEFSTRLSTKEGDKDAKITVPFLSIVPIPHLKIDSLHISFSYEVSQISKTESSTEGAAKGEIGTTGILSKFLTASFSGSIASKSSSSNQMNRRGTLDISLQASESEMPKGLEKLLNILSDSVTCEFGTP